MTAEHVLIAGKALLWFTVPLGIAIFELWSLRGHDSE